MDQQETGGRNRMKLSEVFKEQRKMRKEQEARDIENAKLELLEEYGIERNDKFERAWSVAWDYGHSSGIQEVKNHFADLVDLIKP
jgi:hypothetical protein